MDNLSYSIQQKRQKLETKIYAILCLVLFLGMGFYTFSKWQTYSSLKDAISENQEFIVEQRQAVSDEKTGYLSNKDTLNTLHKKIDEDLKYAFPESDGYTTLTRQLDSFEEELSKKNNPFEVSNINYQTPTENEHYSLLPLRMNIRSSSENFTKFLHLIENSGTLGDQVRLMDISSIRLNFENTQDGTSGSEIINFTVQINAYFQKQSESK